MGNIEDLIDFGGISDIGFSPRAFLNILLAPESYESLDCNTCATTLNMLELCNLKRKGGLLPGLKKKVQAQGNVQKCKWN